MLRCDDILKTFLPQIFLSDFVPLWPWDMSSYDKRGILSGQLSICYFFEFLNEFTDFDARPVENHLTLKIIAAAVQRSVHSEDEIFPIGAFDLLHFLLR